VCHYFDKLTDLDSLEEQLEWPNPYWLEWVGYGKTHQPAKLLEFIQDWKERQGSMSAPIDLEQPGYVVNSHNMSFNQLRNSAEKAIRARQFGEAAASLELAQLIRPDHRNVRRRLVALRRNHWIARRLGLLLSPRFNG
jgi:hypothetical protein